MTEQRGQTVEEERLRRCMSDLLSLVALPALWVGKGVVQISQVLLSVLPVMLEADFVYIRLIGDDAQASVEDAWLSSRMPGVKNSEVGAALIQAFGPDVAEWPQTGKASFGNMTMPVVQARLGLNGQLGVLAAGSSDPVFPGEAERLLLNVAGNQVALAFNEALSILDQKRHAAQLDMRVAQRTQELAATNRALASEIVERKRAESELRRSAAFLAQAQKLTMTGSTWWNVTTDEIVWSEETYRLIEYPQSVAPTVEMAMERCHPGDSARVGKIIGFAASQGKDVDLEHRLLMPDGRVKHVKVVLQNIAPKDERPEFLGAVTDITERKASEERLRRSEMLLAAGERISLTGTFSWKLDTDELLFSDQLKRIFGFSGKAPVNFDRIAQRVHPEDRLVFQQKIVEIGRGMPSSDYEIRILDDEGGVKFLRFVGRVMRDLDGNVEYIGAVQDVTMRRSAEEARDSLRSELNHVTRVMSLGALTASIAHEVNQPLSGIITNAGTCLEMLACDPPNVAVAIETARRTIRDGNRAAEVVARLRALFRKTPATVEVLDLNESAREVVGLLWNDLQKARVRLDLDLADDLSNVAGDRVQLQQVIMNLMRNAIDAMDRVDDRPREMLVRTINDGHEGIRMSIQDSGEGFGPTDPDRFFSAFYTTKEKGMGVGLSVSRSIIESHEGQIWAERNEKHGSTLVFCLPQHRQSDNSLTREAKSS